MSPTPPGSAPTRGRSASGSRRPGSTACRDDDRLAFDEGFFAAEPPAAHAGRGDRPVVVATGPHPCARSTGSSADDAVAPSRRPSSPATRRAAHARRGRRPSPSGDEPVWVDVELGGEPFDVINNAGSALYPHGFGGDRGFLERDRGQYDEPAEVFAWCGGAVLLRRAYLDDVGLFDERLFLYYEDTDLSWRGRLRGWRYLYVPTSVVRHRHAAVVGRRVAGVPLLHRTQPAARAGQERAGRDWPWRAGSACSSGPSASTRPRSRRAAPDAAHAAADAKPPTSWRLLVGYVRFVPAMVRDRWRRGRRRS